MKHKLEVRPGAKPLGKKNAPKWQFMCECGYVGKAYELLEEDGNETLYCPVCGTAGWTWM